MSKLTEGVKRLNEFRRRQHDADVLREVNELLLHHRALWRAVDGLSAAYERMPAPLSILWLGLTTELAKVQNRIGELFAQNENLKVSDSGAFMEGSR